jgi:ElaB/YqjD/DUF883 family membrane-anchored ribosome-binding protein
MKNESDIKTESPEEIVEHIGRLMSEAEALLVGPAAERAGDKMHELRARFENLQEKAVSAYGEARRKVIAGARVTDETIRTHPYESLAIALGVGVLLGALVRRGNS